MQADQRLPMLEQVLQRAAVLQQLQRVKSELSSAADSHRRASALTLPSLAIDGKQIELTDEDLKAAEKELAEAELREKTTSSGQPGFKPMANRRGDTAKPLDDVVFLSREPAMGLLQSALEQYHLDEKPATVTKSIRRAAGQWEPVSERRLLNEFSVTDPRWVASVVAWGLKLFRNPHPFKAQPAEMKIGNQARVIVVGDWGSGIERAQRIATMMRDIIEKGRGAGRQQHVIHLGDVYYSGWGWECRGRFLTYWPVKNEEADSIFSWSLNGNHDMYSGGYGYFDEVLGDSRFQCQQGASYFRLFNDDWQLLGLDTAYREKALREPQSEWIRQQTTESRRKTMLMSHHQPFTIYEKDSIEMDEILKGVLGSGAIHSWLFGHEHRCILYNEHFGIKYPRLIGHGGVPVYMTHGEKEAFQPPVLYEYRKYIPGGLLGIEHWAPFGFAVLDFDGPEVQVQYIYENGFIYPGKNKSEVID